MQVAWLVSGAKHAAFEYQSVNTGWSMFNPSTALALITRHYSLISPEPPVGNQLIPVAA